MKLINVREIGVGMINDLILKLEQIGLSSYEAKAYYALIRKSPANGYEISKIAKIPISKVYEILNRLKVKGVILESIAESGMYYPIPPVKLLNKAKLDFTRIFSSRHFQWKYHPWRHQ